MSFTLPELPYAMDALAPQISKETLEYHYGKHHNAYVTNLNKLTDGKPEAGKSLEELIKTAKGPIFNNAALNTVKLLTTNGCLTLPLS